MSTDPAGKDRILPDPERKPTRAEMRAGGMVAMAALGVIFLLTILMIWIGG